MRKTLLAGAAFGAVMAGSAQAQVQAPGIYGFALGSFLFDAGKRDYAFQDAEPALGTRDAFSGRLQVGYRFDAPVDVAVAAQGAAFRRDRPSFLFAERLSARYAALDLEVGYTIDLGGAALRAAIGPRYLDFRHAYTESGDRLAMKYKGIGPRAALGASGRLGTSEFSLFGEVSGSVLFGRLREAGGGDDIVQHRAARGRTAYNAEAQVGIAWEPFPLVSVAAGIRYEAWWGVNDRRAGFPVGIDGRGNRIGVGPFIRLAYNWAAPPGTPAATPRAINGVSFIVFFDFDRTSLTAVAVRTIKQVADYFRSGQGTRMTVTGHADRAGTDAYNMALSLRRANIVKDQLVREGVPVSQIVIVGRGESQPLAPTADGVREPQNRRVEIVPY